MINDILKLRRVVIAGGVTGALALIAMVFAFLAFDDIAAGEPDLSAEWFTVQVAFFLMLLFMAVMFWLLAEIWVLIGKARDHYGR